MNCPECGSEEYTSNGVDGYICLECGTQYFDESDCVNCIPEEIEDAELVDGEYVLVRKLVCIFCGKVLHKIIVPQEEE